MTSTGGTLAVIPDEECYELLSTQEIGRLGTLLSDRPSIIPVNYGLDGRTIVIRTHRGATLTAARDATVAFEVDEIDRVLRRGWSVLVIGWAEELGPAHAAELRARARAAGAEPWAPGEHGTWLRIVPREITGRRIVPGQLPWGVDDRAYL